jgi:hypothetical protein
MLLFGQKCIVLLLKSLGVSDRSIPVLIGLFLGNYPWEIEHATEGEEDWMQLISAYPIEFQPIEDWVSDSHDGCSEVPAAVVRRTFKTFKSLISYRRTLALVMPLRKALFSTFLIQLSFQQVRRLQAQRYLCFVSACVESIPDKDGSKTCSTSK